VNFSIVSQVNPHINLFFFSPRGSPGWPVTHRRGRGWRGGFLGSTIETSIKLDLQKYLKILRHLELLPRPLGQDWSEIWLQRFSGTITIWPKSVLSDFFNILSDPSPARLGRMLRAGERSCWPKIRFISNRLKVERVILAGLRRARSDRVEAPLPNHVQEQQNAESEIGDRDEGMTLRQRGIGEIDVGSSNIAHHPSRRQSSILEELGRQASVLWQEDVVTDGEDENGTDEDEEAVVDGEVTVGG
jgi:hypothetical protein